MPQKTQLSDLPEKAHAIVVGAAREGSSVESTRKALAAIGYQSAWETVKALMEQAGVERKANGKRTAKRAAKRRPAAQPAPPSEVIGPVLETRGYRVLPDGSIWAATPAEAIELSRLISQ